MDKRIREIQEELELIESGAIENCYEGEEALRKELAELEGDKLITYDVWVVNQDTDARHSFEVQAPNIKQAEAIAASMVREGFVLLDVAPNCGKSLGLLYG